MSQGLFHVEGVTAKTVVTPCFYWSRLPDSNRGPRFPLGNGRRGHEALEVTNLTVAERKAREINDLLEAGQYAKLRTRQASKHKTFSEAVKEFLRTYDRWSDSTRESTMSTVNMLVEEFGDRPIRDIDSHAIDGYLARRRDEGLSRASSNRYLAALKVIFKKAAEWGYLVVNPADLVKMMPEQQKKPNPYLDDELEQLLSCLQPRHRQIAEVYLQTGMRRGELMKLMWKDVDFGSRLITVRDPKNNSDRVIPMSELVREILWDMRHRDGEAHSSLVVLGSLANIRQVLTRAMERAGIAEDRRDRPLHRLRDTFGTKLAEKGVPADRIQKLMGHRDIAMTLRYVETREQGLRDAIAVSFGS